MSDDMLSRYTRGTHRQQPSTPAPAPLPQPPSSPPSPSFTSSSSASSAPTSADTLDAPCIAVLSGSTALMLDLVFRDGNRLALGYSYLSSVALDRSGTLTLSFVTHTVTVKGRDLAHAYATLRSHTCLRLSEASRDFDPGTGEVFIAGIEVREA